MSFPFMLYHNRQCGCIAFENGKSILPNIEVEPLAFKRIKTKKNL
ncbi:hypothetical protein I656_00950 [Geobacillus sp. WSUCF1]|nr:hypothetical protein I656_00950 [Geobacillus sp. WSUCF1]